MKKIILLTILIAIINCCVPKNQSIEKRTYQRMIKSIYIIEHNGVCIACNNGTANFCTYGISYIDCDRAKEFGFKFIK